MTTTRDIFTFAPAPRPEHFGKLQRAQTVSTSILAEVADKVEMTLAARQIMMLWGPPGTGKTYALRYVLAGKGFAELVFSETPSRKETLNAVHAALFGRPGTGNSGQIERTLKLALRDHAVILVVDEVESLNNKRLHLLRTLQDFPGSQLTLFLIGDENSRETVENDRRLSRRILTDVHFTAMSDEAVMRHLPSYHPLFERASRRRRRELCEVVFGGNWGDIARWTQIAEYTASQESAATLTDDLLAKIASRYWKPAGNGA